MNKIDDLILKLLRKAHKKNEIPVAAIITLNNKVISSGFNKKNKTKNVTDHAEIIAIKKASKKLKDWRLNDCTLYTSMYPCDMCQEVIKASRIKQVFYILPRKKKIETSIELNEYKSEIKNNVEKIMNKSFKKMRTK